MSVERQAVPGVLPSFSPPFTQTRPSLRLLLPGTPPGSPWPPARPCKVATEWALCLDTAISSQRTSEM